MEMSQLDDIAYVDTFKLQTVSGDNAPAIYANGRHQVAIQIIVKAVKNDDKPMKDSDEMFKGLHLCFADDGSKLNWQGNNNWTYTDVEGEFNGESLGTGPISTIVSDDGTMIFKWFVSSTIVQIRRIAASIYTSTKYFTTADKPSGAEKSSVRIEARQPIDYNDHTNTEIKSGAFDTLKTDLFWESNLPAFNLYKKHYDGTSKRRIVYIHPTSKTGQTKFKKHEIVYTPLYNSDICTNGATLKWHNGIKLSCFDLINSSGMPCAVIGRCLDKKEFQISMWYSRQNSIGIGGSVFIESKHYYNLLEPEVNEDHFGVDEHGIPTLLLYQFSFTTDDKTTHYKWENKMNSPTVKLTDHYGNEGSFQLIFNDESNFDEPGRRSLNSNQQSD